MAEGNTAPANRDTLAQTHVPFGTVVRSWGRWWRMVIRDIDQAKVIETRREEAYISGRYMFMTAMSGGIAILGLLLSSPAVVIGAMLLSPLMGPIIGLGFALAIGDYAWLRKSARALLAGSVMAIVLCALIVFLSPIQTVTSEIASRTRPNLFDLLVALFSALAGAYAMIRGREGAIVGVAIATALMPPLAVVGFGLATVNWTVFSGALLLFVTNAIVIAVTAMLMARLYGFRADLTGRQTMMQNLAVFIVFVLLAVPLGYSLIQIGREANGARIVRSELQGLFDDRSRLSQVDIDWRADPVAVDATVLTPTPVPQAEVQGARTLQRLLGRPVQLRITQYQVGTGAQAAEAAQLAAAQAEREADESARIDALSRELALVAGTGEDAVTIDRGKRRAVVRAQALPGAGLATYRALERRIAADADGWAVAVEPPQGALQIALPTVAFADGEPTRAGASALALVSWAAQRSGRPVVLSGPEADAAAAAATLRDEGVTVRTAPGPAPLRATWDDAGDGAGE
ncbi:TIGR00341 family protein [Tsuneonella amylolytica]|uniref:TIGR00341 family protein n=1 Tax=Tsuneonella amylolytica TaxID=2338327 RepID=UPI000EAA16A8|nr:TIGR00341 family protein [Tsuneonella amylolytica]